MVCPRYNGSCNGDQTAFASYPLTWYQTAPEGISLCFRGSVVFEPAVDEAFPLEWWTQKSPGTPADPTGVELGGWMCGHAGGVDFL